MLIRLKGFHEPIALRSQGLMNALLPVITFAAMPFVQYLGAMVVNETVFTRGRRISGWTTMRQ